MEVTYNVVGFQYTSFEVSKVEFIYFLYFIDKTLCLENFYIYKTFVLVSYYFYREHFIHKP